MKTDVAIIGAGPAGLYLAQMLHNAGINSVLLEAKSEDYVIDRVRAGVMEQGAVDTLKEIGVGEGVEKDGLVHDGIIWRFDGQDHYIDVQKLTGGRSVIVYGQQSVVRDLINARRKYSDIHFSTPVTKIEDTHGKPKVHFELDGKPVVLECDFVAGCDGFHGISRQTIPEAEQKIFEHVYPYSWLGVLAEAKPSSHVVIYSHHENGFALSSMRSEEISRLYIQVNNDDSADNWSDDALWDELELRLGNGVKDFKINRGPILQKGITPMRSYVCETMRYGNIFLAGDAAHIVPPTGAKGLNLAVGDVRVLSAGLKEYYAEGKTEWLDKYAETCLDRIWKVERFSWWTTTMFHPAPDASDFDVKMQLASLNYLANSEIGAASFAENYVGLPYAV